MYSNYYEVVVTALWHSLEFPPRFICVRASHVVTHRATDLTQIILTSEIGRDRVYWSGFRLCLGNSEHLDNGYLSYDTYVPLRGKHILTTNHRSTQGKEIKNWHAACCSAVEVSFPSVGIDYWRPHRATTHRNLLLVWGCALISPRRLGDFGWLSKTKSFHGQSINHLFLPSHRPSC